jgi:hypothetical protein
MMHHSKQFEETNPTIFVTRDERIKITLDTISRQVYSVEDP